MLIGLVDLDLINCCKQFIPSIELMLASSYHKKKGDIVRMIFNTDNIEPFDKLIVYKNKSKLNVPDSFFNKDLVLFGEYFNLGHESILPDDYFKYVPDMTIYSFNNKKEYDFMSLRHQAFAKNMPKNYYPVRLGQNGKIKINSKKIKTDKEFIVIYDEEIFNNNLYKEIIELNKNKKIVFTHSHICEDFNTFIFFKDNITFIGRIFDVPIVVFTGNLTPEVLSGKEDLFNSYYVLGFKKWNGNFSDTIIINDFIKKIKMFKQIRLNKTTLGKTYLSNYANKKEMVNEKVSDILKQYEIYTRYDSCYLVPFVNSQRVSKKTREKIIKYCSKNAELYRLLYNVIGDKNNGEKGNYTKDK